MVTLFEANDPNATIDGPLTARDLLDQGAHRIRGAFTDAPALRAELLVLLGDLYRRIDELDAAAQLLSDALPLAESIGDPAAHPDAMFGQASLDAPAPRHQEGLA